jgi:hypothetical protein
MTDEVPENRTAMQRTLLTAKGKLNWVGIARYYLAWVVGLTLLKIAVKLVFHHPIVFDLGDWAAVALFPVAMLIGEWFRLPGRDW